VPKWDVKKKVDVIYLEAGWTIVTSGHVGVAVICPHAMLACITKFYVDITNIIS